jgi:hypothetical protein
MSLGVSSASIKASSSRKSPRRRIEERRELERHTVAAFWKAGVEFPRSGPDETERSLKNEIQKSGSAFDSF